MYLAFVKVLNLNVIDRKKYDKYYVCTPILREENTNFHYVFPFFNYFRAGSS